MTWHDPWLYPAALAEKEREFLDKRRERANVQGNPRLVGFALSGGGIRSATFCLGVFQALARRGLLGNVDFLSTVSGGGYFGGFLGALFSPDRARARNDLRASLDPKRPDDVGTIEAALGRLDSKILRRLRDNGRYLSPAGAGDALLSAAAYLRNLVALHIVLGSMLLAVFLAATALASRLTPRLIAWGAYEIAPLPLGGSAMWWSPWMWAAVAPLLIVAVPAGWAYWLTQRGVKGRGSYWTLAGTLGIALACLLPELGWSRSLDAFLGVVPRWTLGGVTVLAVLVWLLDDVWARRTAARAVKEKAIGTGGELEFRLLLVRNRLTKLVKRGLVAAAVLLCFGVIDSLGRSVYVAILAQGLREFLTSLWTWPPVAALLAAFVAVRRLVALIPTHTRLRVPGRLIASVAALIMGVLVLTIWAAVAHAFAWGGRWPDSDVLVWRPAAAGTAVAVALSWLISRTMQFLNNSSHHAMYAARLTRAYLGASNLNRWTDQGSRISEVLPGDAISMHDYRPQDCGGPLHVINVTLNQTVSGRDGTEYRDRKGLGMAVGPAGVSIAATHHALWKWSEVSDPGLGPALGVVPVGSGHPLLASRQNPHPVQNRQLGHWLAISGAAFTTGLGARTSLPLAVLLGLANVRLGYWWDSHVNPPPGAPRRPWRWMMRQLDGPWAFPVQGNLLDEFLGRYWGPAKRYWYLSDGGHFENTGCYELIRRRLPVIVCCDCGADPDYSWADLSGLVLKARLDFNAEIEFLEGTALTGSASASRRNQICEMSGIRRTTFPSGTRDAGERAAPPTWSDAHAIVGHVYYLDDEQKRKSAGPDSVLLVIKPSLTGDEPADVLEYARSHPSFPQEPTSDQYFDEAQWESYRKLGEHIGSQLFSAGESWYPAFHARVEPLTAR